MPPSTNTSNRPTVALLVETSNIYGRRILEGVASYLHTRLPWSIHLDEAELESAAPSWLHDWHGDGVLCRPMTPQLAEALKRNNVPAIDLNDHGIQTGLPSVSSDNRAIGRVGAEHLIERGFENLAFCGFAACHWSALRNQGFHDTALSNECVVHASHNSTWRGSRDLPWEQERDQLAAWMQSLPRPIGIMACNDVRAQQVLDAARHINIAVPEEIAVLGVDNDELLCEICEPSLSSVAPNPHFIGHEAARLLDVLMQGQTPDALQDSPQLLVPPLGVIARRSTDIMAIPDREVAKAIRLIREHACAGFRVDDLLDHVPLSRATLERRFRKYLGRSPQAEIRRIQMDRVKQLLVQSDMPLTSIARLTGFEHPEYLSVVFKREEGCTPGQHRQKHQTHHQAPNQTSTATSPDA